MIVATRETTTVVRVVGVDARRYLHSQLSNDVAGLAAGSSCCSLLLEPAGRVVALVRVVCVDEETFLLEFETPVDDNVVDGVVGRLSRFLIRTKATIDTIRVEVSRVRSTTDEALPGGMLESRDARPSWWRDGRAVDVFGSVDDFLAGAGASVTVVDDVEAERVRRGWPANGAEVVAGETIPASLGVVPVAVSFTKGCYPGQELVERMDSRGSTAPRTLRVVEGSNRAVGDEIVVDGVVVGTVTSSAGGRSLAFVDRAVDHGEPVSPMSRGIG